MRLTQPPLQREQRSLQLTPPPLQPWSTGQATFAEPGEMPPDVGDAFESKRFDRFASNMRDGFLDGIGGVDQG